MVTLKEIKDAQEVLKGVIHRTHMVFSKTFSEISGANIYLKAENLQKTGSFKIRGAYYRISKLTQKDRKKGVVAVSAGNHAQGVAYAAACLGIKAVVVMPEFTSAAKIAAARDYGAEVILNGANIGEARDKALQFAQEGMIFIPPFDDPYIIAGQGTIGLEMLEDMPLLDMIIVPVGGGGLISGIAAAVKTLKPSIEIIGVEIEGYDAVKLSIEEGKKTKAIGRATIADGIAIGNIGEITYPLIKKYVNKIVVVSDAEVSTTMLWLLERAKYVVEGAGAVGLAAVLSRKVDVTGNTVGIVLSGGNIDLKLLQLIINKGSLK